MAVWIACDVCGLGRIVLFGFGFEVLLSVGLI